MCKSNITLKKLLKLLLEIEFYKIIIFFIFVITGYESFSIKNAFKDILPITTIAQDFIGCFLLFYLFIPFINILLKNLTEKQHISLLITLLFTYSILGNIPKITVVMNYITLFFMIYVIGSYIRIYPKKLFSNKKVVNILFISCIFACIISILFCFTICCLCFYFVFTVIKF